MLTTMIAAATAGGCAAVKRRLERSGCPTRECAKGQVKVKPLWNEGAAFGLSVKPRAVIAASGTVMAVLWLKRKEHPVSTGLVLGGGLSNLSERLLHGRVLDYLRFPKAPGKVKRYVYNLADLAIFAGGLGFMFGKRK